MSRAAPSLLSAAVLLAASPALATDVTLGSARASGFSDQTAQPPEGLNPGTTRGDQALIVFQTAGAIWGATLGSRVPVLIDARFLGAAQDSKYACAANQGVVLAATSTLAFQTSPSLPSASTAYPIALANALSGTDLTPGRPQLQVGINADLGTSRCVFPARWYFGIDTGAYPTGSVSLLSTLLHEFAHGLGFESKIVPSTGAFSEANGTAFDAQVAVAASGSPWTSEAPENRKALVTTPRGISFAGPAVRQGIPFYLGHPNVLTFTSGSGPAFQPEYTVAEFSGPQSGTGQLVAAAPLDACTALTNAAELSGKFALIQRSFSDADLVCSFVEKANRAVAAGAIGVVVFDRTQEALIAMAGTPAINVPAVFIGVDDGQALQARLAQGPVTVSFQSSARLSNTDPVGAGVLLFTPATYINGSSVSHLNSNSFPRALLMEYATQPTSRLGMDLTPDVMSDMGWPVVSGLGVKVVKLLDPEVAAGAETSFLVAMVNRRHSDVTAATLDLTLPAGTSVVSATSNPQACGGGFPCALGAIPAGEVRLVVVKVKASSSAASPFAVTASASVTPSDSGDRLSDTITTTVGTGGDLEVTITPPARLTPGGTATMTTTVTNKGPGAAVGVVLKGDISGTGTPLPTVKSNSGGCNTSFPCALGTLAAGASLPVTTTLTVPEGAQSGTFTASVTQQSPEVATANDSASTALSIAGGCSSSGGSGSGLGLAVVAAGLLYGARRSRRRWSV